jgi:hypothetical protein
MVELWHPEQVRVSECQKSPLKELWNSEIGIIPKRLCLQWFEHCQSQLCKVQGAKNTKRSQSANIQFFNPSILNFYHNIKRNHKEYQDIINQRNYTKYLLNTIMENRGRGV